VTIEWSEFKEFRKDREKSKSCDKLTLLVEFIINFYNIHSIERIYEILKKDSLSLLMMKKRKVFNVEDLERHISSTKSKYQRVC